MPTSPVACRAAAGLLLLVTSLPGAVSLVLNDVIVPPYMVRGHSGHLKCDFSADGEQLYAVKWYKDGQEFFRYKPNSPQRFHSFPVNGFQVNMTRSTAHDLHVDKVTLKAAGQYKCEVTSGAPSFWTVQKTKRVQVVDLPDDVPAIRGHLPSYRVGDVMRLNCSSYRSYPPVRLHWYVNEEPVSRVAWTQVESWTNPEPFSMSTTFSRLTKTVAPEDFNDGALRIRCTASMNGTDYWESQEVAASQVDKKEAHHEPKTMSAGAAKHRPQLGLMQVLQILCAVLVLWMA